MAAATASLPDITLSCPNLYAKLTPPPPILRTQFQLCKVHNLRPLRTELTCLVTCFVANKHSPSSEISYFIISEDCSFCNPFWTCILHSGGSKVNEPFNEHLIERGVLVVPFNVDGDSLSFQFEESTTGRRKMLRQLVPAITNHSSEWLAEQKKRANVS